jgi:hypothetical protein
MSPVFACPVKYLPNEIFIQLNATPNQLGRNEFHRGGLAAPSKMGFNRGAGRAIFFFIFAPSAF